MQGAGVGGGVTAPAQCLGSTPTQCGGWEHDPHFEAGRTEAQRGQGTCLQPQGTAGRAGMKIWVSLDAKRAVAVPTSPTRSEACPPSP